MKINFAKSNYITPPSFKGYEVKKSNFGSDEYQFNFPFDKNKYDCYLEIASVNKNKEDYYYANNIIPYNFAQNSRYKMENGINKVNLAQAYGISSDEPFAYRFYIEQKDGSNQFPMTDKGDKVYGANGEFNLVTQKGAKINKGGSMLLLMPDSYNVGWIYDKEGKPIYSKDKYEKTAETLRTFSNKMGGTLAGIEEKIPELKTKGYSRIISTPIFTDDDVSSHSYWIKNAMQMSSNIGNQDNYRSMQEKLFKAGINFVADGAFVNEGLEGIHFKNVLKWGEKSPFYNWFKITDINQNPISLGIIPSNDKNLSHKLINAPFTYKQDDDGIIRKSLNTYYEPTEPTYVQIFDKRFVSDEQKNNPQLIIKEYDNPTNELEINTHNDTIVPYKFEFDPEIYDQNAELLNDYNETNQALIDMNSSDGIRILTKNKNFSLENKFESGFETWDANTDIAKLAYTFSNNDLKNIKNLSQKEKLNTLKIMQEKNFEAQDYAISAGKYWSEKTSKIHLETAANALRRNSKSAENFYYEILDAVKKEELPKNITENLSINKIKNALNSRYELKINEESSNPEKLILKNIMNLPLDSIEFGDDITATMASSYISKRATSEEYLGKSRYELFNEENPHLNKKYKETYEKMDEIYTMDIMPFALNIFEKINEKLPSNNKIIDKNNELTDFGKYTVSLLTEDITKYYITKALYKDMEMTFNKNNILKFPYEKMKDINFKSFNFKPQSPKDEAQFITDKLENYSKKIKEDDINFLSENLFNRISDLNGDKLKVAEMLVDISGSGLDWRIDATKDIADIESIRNQTSNFSSQWENIIDFWKNFTTSVQKENKNAYFTAEITDTGNIWDNSGRFNSPFDAEKKFLHETGMTTIANYSHFFSTMTEIFGQNFETGAIADNRNEILHNKIDNFLKSDQLQSLVYSYTFASNHDKPRLLHCLALDVNTFLADMTDNSNTHARKTAEYVLNKPEYQINFDKVNSKAIAMGETLKSSFRAVISDDYTFNPISMAISDLAEGNFLNLKINPEGFASKPFDKALECVMKQAEFAHGLKLKNEDKNIILNNAFNKIITPAQEKLAGIMSFLVTLPGNPTLYAGDDLSMSGYEEKCKNIYLQNRNPLKWNELNDPNKKSLKNFYEKINGIMSLRNREELQPLNDGTPYLLEKQYPTNKSNAPITALLRQSSNGAMTISLFNASGIKSDKSEGVSNSHCVLNEIKLNWLGTGLSCDTKFYNANSEDKNIYKVCDYNNNYVIKRFEPQDINFSNPMPIDIFDPTMILYSKPIEK